jgi:hypothetical protein
MFLMLFSCLFYYYYYLFNYFFLLIYSFSFSFTNLFILPSSQIILKQTNVNNNIMIYHVISGEY